MISPLQADLLRYIAAQLNRRQRAFWAKFVDDQVIIYTSTAWLALEMKIAINVNNDRIFFDRYLVLPYDPPGDDSWPIIAPTCVDDCLGRTLAVMQARRAERARR
jgi:hypothetical protein